MLGDPARCGSRGCEEVHVAAEAKGDVVVEVERRSGPPLLWDEVLDVLAALERTEFPQAELADQFYAAMPRVAEPSEDRNPS